MSYGHFRPVFCDSVGDQPVGTRSFHKLQTSQQILYIRAKVFEFDNDAFDVWAWHPKRYHFDEIHS